MKPEKSLSRRRESSKTPNGYVALRQPLPGPWTGRGQPTAPSVFSACDPTRYRYLRQACCVRWAVVSLVACPGGWGRLVSCCGRKVATKTTTTVACAPIRPHTPTRQQGPLARGPKSEATHGTDPAPATPARPTQRLHDHGCGLQAAPPQRRPSSTPPLATRSSSVVTQLTTGHVPPDDSDRYSMMAAAARR